MAAVITPVTAQTIAVIGGGFSGTMVAFHLTRHSGCFPLRVLLIEKGPQFGRGLAYGTRCEHHLLNVPAGMMSALPEEPAHFLEWLQARDPSVHAGTFAPRHLYGAYLQDLLRTASRRATVPIELIRDEIVELSLAAAGDSRISLRTALGGHIVADRVVLAIGNQPPGDLPGLASLKAVRRYAADPWGPSLLEGLAPADRIALIGSGLTAIDVIIEAHSRGHRGVIHAISRHGLLPRRHQPSPPRPHFPLTAGPHTARALLSSVRAEAKRSLADGGDWRSVIDAIRPVAQSLWKSLDTQERQRFIRHLAPHWDVHRHRVAPEIDDRVQSLLRDGRLVVVAGRVLALEERAGQVNITLIRRGCTEAECLKAARVINCTGPARDVRACTSPLLRCLLASGITRPGPLALGLAVADSGALVRADGTIHDRVFAVGPLLKEHLWETTAVRELRTQAAELAQRLLVLSSSAAPLEKSA